MKKKPYDYLLLFTTIVSTVALFWYGFKKDINSEPLTMLDYAVFLAIVLIIFFIRSFLMAYLCAKFTGYKFLSYSIFNKIFIKIDSRIIMGTVPGLKTRGFVEMMPKDDSKTDFPHRVYFLYYPIFCILISIISLVLFAFAGYYTRYSKFLFIICLASFSNLLLCFTSDSIRNFKRILSYKNNPDIMRYYWTMPRITKAKAQGIRYRDMPDEYFEYNGDCDFSDPYYIWYCYLWMMLRLDSLDMEGVLELCERVISPENKDRVSRAEEFKIQKLFIMILSDARIDKINLLTDEIFEFIRKTERYIINTHYHYAVARLLKNDSNAAARILERFNKDAEKLPYDGVLEMQKDLMALVDKEYERRISVSASPGKDKYDNGEKN